MEIQGAASPKSVSGIPLAGKLVLLVIWMIAVGWIWLPAHTAAGQKPRQGDALSTVTPPDKSLGVLAPTSLDLEIQKSHSGDLVIDSSAVFVIAVTNVSTQTVTGTVTVNDNFPAGLTPLDASGPGWSSCAVNGQLVTCVYSDTAGVPPSGGLPAIVVAAQVGQAAAPSVTNIATLANANDSNPANNTAVDTATVVSADLAVSKTVTPTNSFEGATITFTLGLVNQGPSSATGVVLTDTLATGLTFSSSNASRGTYNPANGVWSVGDLANTEAVTLTLSATVNANTRGTTIADPTNGLTSALFDYDTANNAASASVQVATTRLIGQVLDLGTNQPIISATLILTDSVNHVYTTTSIASGWFTFTDTTATPIAGGAATLAAAKANYEDASAALNLTLGRDNRQDLKMGTADLVVTLTDGKTQVIPGETYTYTISVVNEGSIPATQVVITDVLPANVSFITDTLDISPTVPVAGTYVWRLSGELAPTVQQIFRVRVQAAPAQPSATASLKNTVRARTGSPEANLANNVAEDTNTTTGVPNVGITISVSPSQVRTGSNATYTIRVTNTGSAPVTEATVTDTFANVLDLTGSTSSKGKVTTNNTTRRVTVEIGVLNINETVTITVIGRVNNVARANQTVTNAASMTYKFAGATQTRTTTNVSFQLIFSSTLPGTGGIELPVMKSAPQPAQAPGSTPIYWLALGGAILLGVLGLAALVSGLRLRQRSGEWSAWLLKMGILFATTAVIFGVAGLSFWALAEPSSQIPPLASGADTVEKVTPVYTEEPIIMPAWAANEPEKLPDFPIPTPTVASPPEPGEDEPDTSPVNRILVPAIGLDTVVKYVPFDGLTWMIAGLHQEVAWMGDTSWPGLGGNTALAGHITLRTGGDGPFRHLDLLAAGDEITLATDQNIYLYRVVESRVVDETDLSILQNSGGSRLTLITCSDWNGTTGFYMRRLAVSAELVETTPIKAAALLN